MHLISYVIASIILIISLVSCNQDRTEKAASNIVLNDESRKDALGTVQVGMTEPEVKKIMGDPEEVRFKGELGIVSEKCRWVYGVENPGGFPMIGSVIFDVEKKVVMTYCPSRGIGQRWKGVNLPISELPQKTNNSLYCRVDKNFKDKGFHQISVSIFNEGEKPFLYSHDNTGIRFSILLEIFDDTKTLMLQQYLGDFHSPHFSKKSDYPILRLNPGQKKTECIPVFWLGDNDGRFKAGTYFIRVAFPFEEGKLYSSNLLEFQLDNPANEKP